MKIKILADGTSSLTFKLAETSTVRGVYSPDFGRLLHLRVVGQNSVIVNLPEVLAAGHRALARRALRRARRAAGVRPRSDSGRPVAAAQEPIEIPLQPRFLYSNRSYWYPQSTVTDYATATIRLTVPNDYDAIATGEPVGPPTPGPGDAGDSAGARRSCSKRRVRRGIWRVIISRFNRVDTRADHGRVPRRVAPSSGTPRAPVRRPGHERTRGGGVLVLRLAGRATRRIRASRSRWPRAIGPGGHSPPYFAVLNQVVPGSHVRLAQRSGELRELPDVLPRARTRAPVVGPGGRLEELSRAVAQRRVRAVLRGALRGEGSRRQRLPEPAPADAAHRDRCVDADGPIYLGYRLGHIQGDDRIFRAIVYNKGAMVLHMLRRLIGDDAFFGACATFYEQWKFKKAGTDDFRAGHGEGEPAAICSASSRRWVFGSAIPRVKFSYHVSANRGRRSVSSSTASRSTSRSR